MKYVRWSGGPPGPRLLVVAALSLGLVACDHGSALGVTLTIDVLSSAPVASSIDAFRFRADIDGANTDEGRERTIELDGPAAVTETVNLAFDRRDAGKTVVIIVQALSGGAPTELLGRTTVTLVAGEFVPAAVRLADCAAPDGPFCDGEARVFCDPETRREVCPFGCDGSRGECFQCRPSENGCDGDRFVRCGPDGVPLGSPEDCAALANPCRGAACSVDGCVLTNFADDDPCDDGLFCTENTVCTGGLCGGGGPRICDDGDGCTFDYCEESLGRCEADPSPTQGLPCLGAAFCVVQQTCDAGACSGGVGRDCTDDNSCTTDLCDEANDRCTHSDRSPGSPCEDGAFCTLGDLCDGGGVCLSGVASPCADANPCTDDGCDEDLDLCAPSFVTPGTVCRDSTTATTCDGTGQGVNEICAFGCNTGRQECNACDPLTPVTCRADVELLCNAEILCNADGTISDKTCCGSNRCDCAGSGCLEAVCDAAPEVGGGGTFLGDTCDASDQIPGDCYPGGQACQSVGQGGAPESLFRLLLDDGTATSRFYNVTLDASASSIDTDLRLSTVCGSESLQLANAEVCVGGGPDTASLACLDGAGSEVLALCGLPEGEYFGAVDSAPGVCGDTSMLVTTALASLDVDTQAGNVSRGGVFRGNTCALGSDYSFPDTQNAPGCASTANCVSNTCPVCTAAAATDCRVNTVDSFCAHSGAGSKDAVFFLSLPVASGVDVSSAGSGFDTVLYIVGADGGGVGSPGPVRVCNDDCFDVDGASHIQTSLAAGLYYVVLDGAAGACGDFVLTVVVSPAATCPNLTCETAFESCATCPLDCQCQRCGDGAIQLAEGERCDDGNNTEGDGCSALCEVEPGQKCHDEPSDCMPHCGDGDVDEALGEECDDNNTAATDGCSPSCVIEATHACSGSPSFCSPGVSMSACPELLIPQTGAFVTSTVSVAPSFSVAEANVDVDIGHAWVGDLTVQLVSPAATNVTLHNRSGGSTNDIVTNFDRQRAADGPGTLNSFDGQNAQGTWTLRLSDSVDLDQGTLHCWTLNLSPASVCGNGACEPPLELCGDCPADCPCSSCGNRVQEPSEGEECDDGNLVDDDGCSATCRREPNFACSGARPTVCVSTCGNGDVDEDDGEDCDDGNRTSGDGCDADCGIEANHFCSGEPSVCAIGQRVVDCPAMAVPDNNSTGIARTAAITINPACDVGNILVEVDISHAYIGDLAVDLVAPAPVQTLRLHNRTGSTTDNIVGTYDTTRTPDGGGPSTFSTLDGFDGHVANGTWTLQVRDLASPDSGVLNCWALTIACE